MGRSAGTEIFAQAKALPRARTGLSDSVEAVRAGPKRKSENAEQRLAPETEAFATLNASAYHKAAGSPTPQDSAIATSAVLTITNCPAIIDRRSGVLDGR
jgi:hypothetical protein